MTTPGSKFSGVLKLDRRIAVAPMMDWTDDRRTTLWIRGLRPLRNACLLYVSSHTVHCGVQTLGSLLRREIGRSPRCIFR